MDNRVQFNIQLIFIICEQKLIVKCACNTNRCAANPTGLGLEDAQGFDRELKISPEENLIERRRRVFKKLRGVTNNGDEYTNADESEYRKNHALSSNHTDARKDMYDEEDEFHDFYKGGGKFYMLRPEGEFKGRR